MRGLWFLLFVTLVVTAACSNGPSAGPEEADVKGVRTERSSPARQETSATGPDGDRGDRGDGRREPTTPEADETADPPATSRAAGNDQPRPQPRETVTAVEERTVTETETIVAEPDDSDGEDGTAAQPSPPRPTGPRLASRDGWSHVTWRPQDGSPGGDRWSEVSAAPPVTRGDPGAAETEPVRVRLRAADDSTSAHRQRQATCDAWIVAPADHGWTVRGRLTVVLLAGNVGRVVERHDLDTLVAAGQQLTVLPTAPHTVDAADERDVTCDVRFDAR